MYKNGTGINIDKISETEGNYKQGVEICINNIDMDVDTVVKSISKLIFFNNLVIHSNNIQNNRIKYAISAFNERKIENFNSFASCDYEYIQEGVYAKVGNVLYMIDKNIISHKLFENYLRNFIAVECPIGSVNVTPNREQLQYTDKTIKKLNEVLDKATDELAQMVMKRASQNFNSINEAFKFYTNSSSLALASRVRFNVPTLIDFKDLTVNGKKIPPNIWKIINKVRYDDLPDYLISDILNKTSRRTMRKYIRLEKLLEYDLAIKCDDRLRQVTKSYYCDNHNKTTLVIRRSDIQNLLKHIITRITRGNTITRFEALKAMSFFIKNYKYYKLENDAVPQSYIDSYVNLNRKKKENTDRIDIRRYTWTGAYKIYTLDSYLNYYVFETYSKKKLRNEIKLVIYSINTKDDDLIRDLSYAFRDKKVEFITLKKEHLSAIPKSRVFMSLENFLTLRQKIIAKAATADYLKKKFGEFYNMMDYANNNELSPKTAYQRYIYRYEISGDKENIAKLLRQYQEKKWLDWAAIINFSLSDKDIKRLMQRQILHKLDNVTDSLLYVIKGKYSKDSKFGIKPDKKTILLLTKLLGK